MDAYNTSAAAASRIVTQSFSTSFSSASKLFAPSIRQDIYNIYGLVRIADEIVDTYQGKSAKQMLGNLEKETYQALQSNFSANLIVHAFVQTAGKFRITEELIAPFFTSMRTDLTAKTFSKDSYQAYIYGSAEVVGLMCLKVFCEGDDRLYAKLEGGARALGSAFQKVNFLRDMQDDYDTRGRYYFPTGNYISFSESEKDLVLKDIAQDFNRALPALNQLPSNSQKASKAAFAYYQALLRKLESAPVKTLKSQRISVGRTAKLMLLLRVKCNLL